MPRFPFVVCCTIVATMQALSELDNYVSNSRAKETASRLYKQRAVYSDEEHTCFDCEGTG